LDRARRVAQPYRRALYQDQDGVLWIGTYDGGLGRFKDGKFTRYTTQEGLFNNGVFQILEDGRGHFWLSSNRGVYRVSKQEVNEFASGQRSFVTSVAYGKSDGMLNVECNGGRWPAGVKTREGHLWFPTQDGVAVVDPEAVPTNPQPPPVRVESFLIDRAPVAFNARFSPDRKTSRLSQA
jgi:ligand-binding sensor domain-containing protein